MKPYMYPKMLGGTTLLNLEDHMVARGFNLLRGMCICTEPWVEIICPFVEKLGIYHGKTINNLYGGMLLNNAQAFKCLESIMVQQLVLSRQQRLKLQKS